MPTDTAKRHPLILLVLVTSYYVTGGMPTLPFPRSDTSNRQVAVLDALLITEGVVFRVYN